MSSSKQGEAPTTQSPPPVSVTTSAAVTSIRPSHAVQTMGSHVKFVAVNNRTMRGITFISIAVCSYWVLKLCFGKRKGTIQDVPNKHFALFAIIVFFGLLFGVPYWGNKIPGSVFERKDYEGLYHAILYKNRDRSLPKKAVVLIESRVDSSYGYGEEEDTIFSDRRYRLKRLYLPEGGSVTFDYNDDSFLELDKVTNILKHNSSDDSWSQWGIMLLNIPANAGSFPEN